MNENNALESLSNLFSTKLGFKPKLKAAIDRNHIAISGTENLQKYCGKLGKFLFKEITFEFWGGKLTNDKTAIWFSPRVSYTHPSGGSNGINVLWNSIFYNLENNEWLVKNQII